MGVLFSLSDEIRANVQQAFDDLITEFGKMCRLVYPPHMEPCVNCIEDPIGRKSANRWKTGGPMPFPAMSICPLCNGVCYKAVEQTEDIKFLCAFEPKHFFYPIQNLDIRIASSLIQTKGYLSDLPKVEMCDHLVFQTAIEGTIRKKYKLFDSPADKSNIIQDRYFAVTWQQIT